MVKGALTSITFRQLAVPEIIALVREAGLDGIEWGGDIHVPHGDASIARETAEKTRQAGIAVCAYGSYYRAGTYDDPVAAFVPVLESAVLLGAPIIRIWAGNQASADMDGDARERVYADLRNAVAVAADKGIRIATEYHANTLTDTLETTCALLGAVPGLKTFWQPPVGMSHADNLRAIDSLRGQIESLHVFQWTAGHERQPLSEGDAVWPAYLRMAAALPGTHYATMEFVAGDTPAQFLADAKVLRAWLAQLKQ